MCCQMTGSHTTAGTCQKGDLSGARCIIKHSLKERLNLHKDRVNQAAGKVLLCVTR